MQFGRELRAAAATACVLFGTLGPAVASAQIGAQPAPALPTREELNPAERAPQPRRTADRDLFAPEDAGPCPLRDSAVRVTLRSVTATGLSGLTDADLAPAYADVVGQEQPVAVVCDVRDRVSRLLFNRGLLARVEIPEQRIEDGQLRLEVIEAKIVNVRVRGDAGPAQALVERYMTRLRGLAPFDLNVAQRYLLLASDIPGLRLRAAIRPSPTGERGAVDLEVSVTRDGADALVNVQNTGSRAVGRWGGLARLDFNSFTPLGEQTSLVGYHTFDGDEQWVVQLLEELRIGGDGLLARGALVYGETRPGDTLAPLGIEGTSLFGNLELAYPVIRSRRRNLNVAVGLDYIDQETALEGLGTLTEDRLRVIYARADGDLTRYFNQRALTAFGSLMVRKGLSGLGASDESDLDLSRFGGKPDAWVLRATGGAETALTDWASVRVRFEGQYADDPLLAFEEQSIGNLTIGRGYDPSSLTGDSALAGAVDLRFGPFAFAGGRSLLTPYVFYDHAWIDNNDLGLGDVDVASVGAGVQARIANRVVLDVTYAHPLDEPFAGLPDEPESRVIVNLTATVW